MLTPEEALRIVNETRTAYAPTRRYKDAFWTLQMAYNEGTQWGFVANAGGNVTVQALKGLYDVTSPERLRITINEIQRHTAKAASMSSPQRLSGTVYGPCGSTDTYTRTSGKILAALLSQIKALPYVREANKDRTIIGTSGIRRVLRRVGSQQEAVRAQGRRKATMIGQYEVDWASIQPWEVIRSPGARSTQMARDEDCVGHEKPRTLNWMLSNYGWAPETDTRYGQVAHFLDEIHRMEGSGPASAPLLTEAREKAVIPCEYWLADPDKTREIYDQTGRFVRWPWWFCGYLDPKTGAKIMPIPTVGDGGLRENPFEGIGMTFLHYHQATEAMWGTGLVWLLMQWQDFSNIAYTWLAEALQQSASKWMYEDSTLEKGQASRILGNDPRKPIPWRRSGQYSQPPQRIAGAPVPQTAAEIIAMAPEGMNRQSNIAGVQMGQGYKRDGSGAAYETLIREAESVPEDRVTGDELALGEFLRDTLIDAIRHMNVGQLGRLVGDGVSESYLMELKRDDPAIRIAEVRLDPSSMRPKTRQQTEARYTDFIKNMVLTPDQGIKEAVRAGVTGIDTDRERAYQLQQAEIERMKSGAIVEVFRGDEHAWHLEVLRAELNSPNRLDYDDQYIAALQQHELAHQIALEETTGMAMGQPEPLAAPPEQRGTPAAQPAGALGGNIGPAGPQLRIA